MALSASNVGARKCIIECSICVIAKYKIKVSINKL